MKSQVKMKRVLLLILALLFIFASAGNSVFAEDGLYPDLDKAARNSGDENFIKYRDNYYLDTEKMKITDSVSAMFAGFANALLSCQQSLASMQIAIFSMAMQSDVTELLEVFAVPFIGSMRVYVFDEFSLVFISICALILLLRLAVNRQTQALTGLFQAVLIIVLAFLFFNQPVLMLQKADQVTQSVSDTVLAAPYNAVYGDGAATDMDGKIAALVWNVMVHKPWQIAEFGSVEKAKEHEGEILKHAPASDQRKELVKDLAKQEGLFSKEQHYQIGRVTMLMFVGLFNLAIFVFLTFFCGLILMYRFLIMVFMLLGIFIFLLALIPYFGIELVRRWAGRILGVCGTKILLSFLLAVVLVFMDAIYGLIDSKGLLYTLFTIIIIIAALYTKRKDIVSLFAGFKEAQKVAKEVQDYAGKTWRSAGNTVNAGLYMSSRMSGTYGRAKNAGMDSGRTFSSMRKQETQELGLAIWNDPGTGFEFQKDKRVYSGPGVNPSFRSGARQAAGEEERAGVQMKNSSGMKETSVAEKKGADAMREATSAMNRATDDMGRYYRKSELLLQRQYDKSKDESEQKARRTGEIPQYGEFVRRTDAVRALGAGLFDQRDVATTARIMRRVEMSGGDVESIVVGSKEDIYTRAKRPENLSAGRVSSGDWAVTSKGPENTQDLEKSGLAYFRSNFGEEKGERFYYNLRGKYGGDFLESFSSREKLTYSQVIWMIENAGEVGGNATRGSRAQKKKQEAVRMRSPGK